LAVFSKGVQANNYLSLLKEGASLRYEHWNVDRKEVTGYSNFLQIYLDEKKNSGLNKTLTRNLMEKPFPANNLFSSIMGKLNNTLRKILEICIRYQLPIMNQSQSLFSIDQVKFGIFNNNWGRAQYLLS
jgi:hypothetical protein